MSVTLICNCKVDGLKKSIQITKSVPKSDLIKTLKDMFKARNENQLLIYSCIGANFGKSFAPLNPTEIEHTLAEFGIVRGINPNNYNIGINRMLTQDENFVYNIPNDGNIHFDLIFLNEQDIIIFARKLGFQFSDPRVRKIINNQKNSMANNQAPSQLGANVPKNVQKPNLGGGGKAKTNKCVEECRKCITQLNKLCVNCKNKKAMKECVKRCKCCALMCKFMIEMCKCDPDDIMCKKLAKLCCMCLKKCITECNKHKDNKNCKECAAACKKCHTCCMKCC